MGIASALISRTFVFTEIEFPLFAIAVIANLILGVMVLLYGRQDTPRRHFLIFVIAQSLWITTNYLGFLVPEKFFLMTTRLTLFFATFHTVFFLLLVRAFSQKNDLFDKKSLGLLLLAATVSLFTLSSYVFTGLTVSSAGLVPQVGQGIAIFGIFIVICILFALFEFFKGYRRSVGNERAQWRSLAVGMGLMFGLVVVLSFINFAFFQNASAVRFGHLYTLPFVFFVAYAMVKHQLLSVRVLTAQATVILLGSLIFIQLLSAETVRQVFINSVVLLGTIGIGIVLVKGVFREVSQRKKLEDLTQQLEASNVKLQELDKLKSEFLSFASHQVKAPMSVIKGFASLIMDGTYGDASEKVVETAHKIRDSADRLLALVSNLLDLRKIQEGHMELILKITDVHKILKDVVDEMSSLAEKKNLILSFESEPSSVSINLDEEKFRQVIQNLIDNAIKYTDHGWIKVRLAVDNSTHTTNISISDSGRGLSAQLIPKLFEQFTRDKNTAKEISGTGLGLYIAKQIIIGHQGKIWVTSDGEGKGSTFHIQLPLPQ